MSLGLLWVGVPLAQALPAVVAYRVANLLLPALPGMHSHRRIHLPRRTRPRRAEAVPDSEVA